MVALEYQKADQGYGIILINRPEKRNAISEEMIAMFRRCLKQARKDNIKFLVITSAGEKMFCSGGDLTYLHANLGESEALERLNPMKDVLYEIASFPVPVIGVLNGDALGGGCELATACDIRIAKESAKFGFVQSNLGILPGWGGGVLLYEKVHPTFALQWLMEGKVYDTHLLKDKGWINRIVAEHELEDYDKLLQSYISKNSRQMLLLKKQYIKNRKRNTLYGDMSAEVEQTASIWGSEEHKLAVGKFLARK
ncbi:enoyl-CoA hydratase/isomerase family protein [Oceanobacillus halophilus]|uniref:Ethylmalonyl-CoA decarboxylase n=1 Tax=Oceanobacillus halophilus TaxID=930130 RepID=A0A495ABK1_9BACI|nr:enoyl-CoA hydratase/isomerase family protein [Oceanobacillus halophilus]RKQ37386.1 enoyl-CoA hydratase/isomerase family protein [Oceanobacillus halophilus]